MTIKTPPSKIPGKHTKADLHRVFGLSDYAIRKLTKAGMPAPDTIINRVKHWNESQVRVWLHSPDNRVLLPKAVLIQLLEEMTAERNTAQADATRPEPGGSKASVRAGGSEGNTAKLKQELEKIKSILEKTQINLLEMTEKRDYWRAQSDLWEKNYKAKEKVERLQRLRASHRDQELARHIFGGGSTITVDKNFYRRARSFLHPDRWIGSDKEQFMTEFSQWFNTAVQPAA